MEHCADIVLALHFIHYVEGGGSKICPKIEGVSPSVDHIPCALALPFIAT